MVTLVLTNAEAQALIRVAANYGRYGGLVITRRDEYLLGHIAQKIDHTTVGKPA